MNRMRKSVSLLVVLLTLGALLLSAAVSADEKVEIEFWTFWGSETRRPIIEHIVNEFNKSQDRIVVKHVYVPWGDIWTKTLAAVAAGDPPQVVVNDINNVALRAWKKQAMDLTPFIDDVEAFSSQFFPELWKTVVWEDGIYGVSFNTDTRFFMWNKDHFAEVGLDPDKPPTTWAELEEYAQKLDIIHGNRIERLGFYPLFGNFGRDTWMIVGDNGVSWLDDEGNPRINTENKVKTLEWLISWRERYGGRNIDAFQAEFGSQAADPFISGKLSMMVNIATHYTQIRDYGQHLNVGYAPVPEREPGSGHWSWGGGFVLEIPYGAKHAEEAFEFIRFATGPEAQRYWAVMNFDNVANIEGSLLAAEDPRLTPEAREVYQLAVENLEWTIMTPVPHNLAGYLDLINPQLDAAFLGIKSPKEALDQAQKDVEEFIRNAQQ